MVAILGLFVVAPTGCVTTPASTNSVTGVVTPVGVNTNNLAIDAAVINGLVATAVSIVVQKDPHAIPALRDAQMALGGILNGANAGTPNQIIGLLGKNSNATIAAEIGPLINTLSALEQSLLNKYGQTASGQIVIAITRAIYGGFAVGLATAPPTN
jgi:hypothetical protein